jgi:hypothetical protein
MSKFWTNFWNNVVLIGCYLLIIVFAITSFLIGIWLTLYVSLIFAVPVAFVLLVGSLALIETFLENYGE